MNFTYLPADQLQYHTFLRLISSFDQSQIIARRSLRNHLRFDSLCRFCVKTSSRQSSSLFKSQSIIIITTRYRSPLLPRLAHFPPHGLIHFMCCFTFTSRPFTRYDTMSECKWRVIYYIYYIQFRWRETNGLECNANQ